PNPPPIPIYAYLRIRLKYSFLRISVAVYFPSLWVIQMLAAASTYQDDTGNPGILNTQNHLPA
ncbi:hypothetical protein, partial [Lunatibacter salilacus]|uniref:hypothetical protein n=1 Tax=Lunatibacter salilacus TaxID=2483804 RepID=UPI001F39E183